MYKARSIIAVDQFRELLTHLFYYRPDICVRYRLLGELWAHHFLNIIAVTEKGAILYDRHNEGKMIYLSDLSHVMQFEIDAPFEGFQPHFHYDVSPFPVLEAKRLS